MGVGAEFRARFLSGTSVTWEAANVNSQLTCSQIHSKVGESKQKERQLFEQSGGTTGQGGREPAKFR